jgi:spore germination cell wall hydrolase CwlJ-like protein
MNWDDYERALLAIDVWREARNQPRAAKAGVAYSVMNRVSKPGWWGNSISAVVGKKWQYSSMTAPRDPNLIQWPQRGDVSWVECMDVVDCVLAKTEPNVVDGADSYYDNSIPAPKWATPETFVAQVGAFFFHDTDHDHEKPVINAPPA